VFDRFEGGLTIGQRPAGARGDTSSWPEVRGAIEEAVLELIEQEEAPAIERVA
jgi:hypothetical protein